MTTSAEILAQIARAVLYEGYILWPYRKSAIKNQQRWTFGGVYPVGYASRSGGADRSTVCAEVLLESPDANRGLDVSLRFLHVIARQVVAIDAAGNRTGVPELTVDDTHVLSWDEAVERTVDATIPLDGREMLGIDVQIPAGVTEEVVRARDGAIVGAIERRWEAIEATLIVHVSRVSSDLFRVHVSVENQSSWQGSASDREAAIRRTLVSAHIVLQCETGAFLSTENPPREHAAEANTLRNHGLWPALVGVAGDRHTMLASPIILGDYPRIAPESSGDFFDGGEIDQLLVLNVLSMTDEEQAEMAATDPRAREILERCRTLDPSDMMRLHATMRPERFARPAPLNLFARENT